MVEFKQIIGRGTRVRDDYGKLWFNILDYTGSATRNFADPEFDGAPAFATQEEIDEYGRVKETEVITPEEPEDEGGEIKEPPEVVIVDGPPQERRKFYYDGGQVEIAADRVKEVLRLASRDPSFGRRLLTDGSRVLSGFALSAEAKAAILSGDIAWIEKRCGELSAEEREWLQRRLEAEIW
jgi:hypothetical protein